MNLPSFLKMLVEYIPKGSSKKTFKEITEYFSGNKNISNFPNRFLLAAVLY